MQYYNNYTVLNSNETQNILSVTRDEESVEYYGYVKRQLLKTDKKTLLLISSSLRPESKNAYSFIKVRIKFASRSGMTFWHVSSLTDLPTWSNAVVI